jgi:Cys-rich protein (TIGR01571 family)
MDSYQICNLAVRPLFYSNRTQPWLTNSQQCLGFYGLSCLGIEFIMPMLNRGDMRAKYHLEGNACKDCLCAFCCTPCDVAQQDKESAFREEERGPLIAQPEMVDGMQYKVQQEQPAFHHG